MRLFSASGANGPLEGQREFHFLAGDLGPARGGGVLSSGSSSPTEWQQLSQQAANLGFPVGV